MVNKLRIGIIGCGSIAHGAALCFILDPCVELTFCCDKDLVRAKNFAGRFQIKEFTTQFHEVINSPKVDAIYLAVPHYLHYEIVIDAIMAGKPTLCEKPITTTIEDALKIVDLSERNGIKVGVNYQYRYDLAVNQLAEAVKKALLALPAVSIVTDRGFIFSRIISPLLTKGGSSLQRRARAAV